MTQHKFYIEVYKTNQFPQTNGNQRTEEPSLIAHPLRSPRMRIFPRHPFSTIDIASSATRLLVSKKYQMSHVVQICPE